MRLIADTHTHTIASTHAYGTVIEMARGAAEKGLPVLGMTDHAPSMPDSPDLWHFGNLHQLPPVIEGVRVLRGCELNLMDCTGKVDLDEHFLQLSLIHILFSPGRGERRVWSRCLFALLHR